MFEETYLRSVLERAGGNVSEAARLSDMPRRTFYNLLERHPEPRISKTDGGPRASRSSTTHRKVDVRSGDRLLAGEVRRELLAQGRGRPPRRGSRGESCRRGGVRHERESRRPAGATT